MKYSVTKQISFSASHSLGNGYEGKCKNNHGHNYDLFITVSLLNGQTLDQYGFVMDFGTLKTIWKEQFDPLYDHRNLNESLGIQTTAENICAKLFTDLSAVINNERVRVTKLRLYETDTSYAEISL